MDEILKAVNEFNELLYDWIIPRLFNELFEFKSFEQHQEEEITLVREPEQGYFEFQANPDLVTEYRENLLAKYKQKSFHLDTYCFDSKPEQALFWNLIKSGKVEKIWFTGMLTHGQSDFRIHYIDPDSHTVRSYYPDFFLWKSDGTGVIVEVKGDNKIDDPVVKAKAASAQQLASANTMTYRIIKGSDAKAGRYQAVINSPLG
jgi:hypothetical protein